MERDGLRLPVQRRLDRAAGRLGLRGGDHVIGMHRPRHHPALTLTCPGPHPQPGRAAHPPHASPPPGRLLRSSPPRGHRAVPAQRLQVTAQEVLCGAHVPRLRRRPPTAPQHPRRHKHGYDDEGRAPARRTPPASRGYLTRYAGPAQPACPAPIRKRSHTRHLALLLPHQVTDPASAASLARFAARVPAPAARRSCATRTPPHPRRRPRPAPATSELANQRAARNPLPAHAGSWHGDLRQDGYIAMPGARIRLTAPPPHEHQPIGPARRQLHPATNVTDSEHLKSATTTHYTPPCRVCAGGRWRDRCRWGAQNCRFWHGSPGGVASGLVVGWVGWRGLHISSFRGRGGGTIPVASRRGPTQTPARR